MFYPKVSWQKTCSPECSAERNRRASAARIVREQAKKVEERKARQQVILEPMAESSDPDLERQIEKSYYNLAIAIAYSAHAENDTSFFYTPLGKFLCDTVGVNPNEVIVKG